MEDIAVVIVLDEDELALVKNVVRRLLDQLDLRVDTATGIKILLVASAAWFLIRKGSSEILREIASLADIYVDAAKIRKHSQNVKKKNVK